MRRFEHREDTSRVYKRQKVTLELDAPDGFERGGGGRRAAHLDNCVHQDDCFSCDFWNVTNVEKVLERFVKSNFWGRGNENLRGSAGGCGASRT